MKYTPVFVAVLVCCAACVYAGNSDVIVCAPENFVQGGLDELALGAQLLVVEHLRFLSHVRVLGLGTQHYARVAAAPGKRAFVESLQAVLENRFFVLLSVCGVGDRVRVRVELFDAVDAGYLVVAVSEIVYAELPGFLESASAQLVLQITRLEGSVRTPLNSFEKYCSALRLTMEDLRLYAKAWEAFSYERYGYVVEVLRDCGALLLVFLRARAYHELSALFVAAGLYEKVYRVARKAQQEYYSLHAALYLTAVYQSMGQPEKAQELFDKTSTAHGVSAAVLYCAFAVFYQHHGSYEKARVNLHQAFRFAVLSRSYSLLVLCLYSLGRLDYFQGKYESSLHYYQRALAYGWTRVSVESRIPLLVALAESYLAQGQHEISLKYLSRAEKLAVSFDLPASSVEVYLSLAALMDFLGQYSQLRFYADLCVELASSVSDSVAVADGYDALALFYLRSGKLQEALLYHEKACGIYSAYALQRKHARNVTAQAQLYLRLQKVDRAEDLYQKALKLYIGVNDFLNTAVIRLRLALLDFRNTREYSSIYKTFEYAVDLMRGQDYQEGVALVYLIMGDFLREVGRNESAEDLYQESKTFFEGVAPNFNSLR